MRRETRSKKSIKKKQSLTRAGRSMWHDQGHDTRLEMMSQPALLVRSSLDAHLCPFPIHLICAHVTAGHHNASQGPPFGEDVAGADADVTPLCYRSEQRHPRPHLRRWGRHCACRGRRPLAGQHTKRHSFHYVTGRRKSCSTSRSPPPPRTTRKAHAHTQTSSAVP